MASSASSQNGAVEVLKNQNTLLQQTIDSEIELKAIVSKSLERTKPAPGIHPSKTAAPGTWCFGCDNPKMACKCKKGDDEEEKNEGGDDYKREEVFKQLKELKYAFNGSTSKELESLFVQYFQLRKEVADLYKDFYEFTDAELALVNRLIDYLDETQREVLGLDGEPLSDNELHGLMKYFFLLVPDALELDDIEEVYAILQSHDFQRLAYDYASLRLALRNTPAGDLLDNGVKFIYDPSIVARPLGFNEYSANEAFKMQTKLRLVYRDGTELNHEEAEPFLSFDLFRDFSNAVSKFNQVMRPVIHNQVAPKIKLEDQNRRVLVSHGRLKEAYALPSQTQEYLMQDHLSPHLSMRVEDKPWQAPRFTPYRELY